MEWRFLGDTTTFCCCCVYSTFDPCRKQHSAFSEFETHYFMCRKGLSTPKFCLKRSCLRDSEVILRLLLFCLFFCTNVNDAPHLFNIVSPLLPAVSHVKNVKCVCYSRSRIEKVYSAGWMCCHTSGCSVWLSDVYILNVSMHTNVHPLVFFFLNRSVLLVWATPISK